MDVGYPPLITRLHRNRWLAPRGYHLLGGGDAGEKGTMRGGIIVLRTCFAGKEQAIVYQRGQDASAVRLAG
jgi:hypothetical protein